MGQATGQLAWGQQPTDPARPAGRHYFASPAFDLVFFIFPPLLAIVLGLSVPLWGNQQIVLFGYPFSLWAIAFSLLWSAGDIGFYRAYLNKEIFHQFRLRLTVVPLLALALVSLSNTLFIAFFVAEILADIYHSSMQTFGLARIYDGLSGNDSRAGRRLDLWLNLLIYTGPLLVSENLFPHLDYFHYFREYGPRFLADTPEQLGALQDGITAVLAGGAFLFLSYYAWAFYTLSRRGYRYPPLKLALHLSTAIGCFAIWRYQSFPAAYLAVNAFHSVQYYGLIWCTERANLGERLHLPSKRWGMVLVALLFVLTALVCGGLDVYADSIANSMESLFGNGSLDSFLNSPSGWILRVRLVLTLLHYYHDTFIWSVRKKLV